MMLTLENLINEYAALETEIRKIMTHLFSGTCGLCTACCCRADICEEAVESAFLARLLKKQGLGEKDMDDRFGWLDLSGCSLDYGRPPVCYAYYCDELLARLPDDTHRYSAGVLGKLILHIGQQALGNRHLVEIMDPDDLEKINYDRVFQRLEEAQAAFEVIKAYLASGMLNKADREVLAVITTEEP
ncbi:hypothetical protein [Pontiella agarivorans]|uniref:YkgJ family cysteine cluster protein n=1 Tax=Pontiella agarivorans TaxID=3038953 RepID=A0ABU5N1M3_9BACT|nr:hypothetical protein [Pontiella agarivorans]MDZ8120335.1 hypothetical protein [Pontiella agarivorans]